MQLKPFTGILLAMSLMVGLAHPAFPQGMEEIPEDATIVGDYTDRTITLIEVDVFNVVDPTSQIAGVTNELVDGETILGEIHLNAPIAQDEVQSMRERERG